MVVRYSKKVFEYEKHSSWHGKNLYLSWEIVEHVEETALIARFWDMTEVVQRTAFAQQTRPETTGEADGYLKNRYMSNCCELRTIYMTLEPRFLRWFIMIEEENCGACGFIPLLQRGTIIESGINTHEPKELNSLKHNFLLETQSLFSLQIDRSPNLLD